MPRSRAGPARRGGGAACRETDASRNAGARVGKFGPLYLVERLLQQDADVVELVEWNRRRLLILHGALSAPRRHTAAL